MALNLKKLPTARDFLNMCGGPTILGAAIIFFALAAAQANAMGSLDFNERGTTHLSVIQGTVTAQGVVTPGEIIAETINRTLKIEDCIADERAEWSVVGKAEFVGDPWDYTWTITQEWDNDLGKMVNITPDTHQIHVLGEKLMVTFEDGSSFVYGEPLTVTNRVVWSDNLFSLAAYGMDNIPGPYVAIKRSDGAMYLLKVKVDGTCGVGWYLGSTD